MKVTRFVLLFISSLCMLSTFAQDRDFSFDIYDYIVLLPTVEEYSITLDRDGKTLLRHRDTDLFGMHDVVVDTFDKERELKSNGSRKPVQLLTFDEYESTEWLRAKRSSTCFLSTDVSFSGISDERYDVHVVWRFFDIREGYKKPAFEIKRSRNLPLFLMSGLGLLEAEVDEISDEIRSQVKKAWYYQVYNEALSRQVFGELFGSGFDEMFIESGYQPPAEEASLWEQHKVEGVDETEVRASFEKSRMSEIEGIWKTYKQGTSSKCESERFAILSMDDFRWKAIVLPELGGDLSGNNWYIGDVRAFFESTSDPSVFASDWFFPISNDSREKRVFETFVSVDKGKLNVQYEDLNYGCVYIKLFPNTSYESTFQPTSEDSDELVGAGSCVLIDAKCKLFATNAHVVESSSRIALSYNGKEFAAIVVAIDEANDLAVLRAEQFDLEVKPAVLSMGASLGAEITAVGYPRITEMGEDVKLTEGIISAMTFLKNPTMYQISCPITNGNSGGGLFDNRGRLVGLTTAGWRPDETTENVNGAVKTSMIINLLSTIASCETQLEIDVTSSLEDAVRSVGIVRVFAPK